VTRVLIVTGGSRGIGAATARLAGTNGYTVCVNFRRNRQAADEVVRSIEASGSKAVAIGADVSVEGDVVRLFEEADKLGALYGLVNNAGVVETQTRVEMIDAARLQRMFAVNVTSAFLCCREAIHRMSTRHGGKGGAIVNISSGAVKVGSPGEYVDYAATKGAIDVLTIGLAKEVAEEGIRVNAVRPGFIHTDIHAAGGEPNRIERVKTLVPMKRGGMPEEVAPAILWLLSDEASYTSGAFIDVAGGK